jgi:hypothetical protein
MNVRYKRQQENDSWVWRMGARSVESDRCHWYAFVYIGDWPTGVETPEIFFVPSKVIATKRHQRVTSKGWFWMYKKEAERYRGIKGVRELKKSLAE